MPGILVISKVVVYLGPARAGKTEELLRQYRDALRREPCRFGKSLWLAPTSRAAATIRGRVMTGGPDACFSPGVLTFDDLTARVLRLCQTRVRRIDLAMQRELLRRLVRSALERGELVFYAEAAGRPGFIELLVEHLRELKRHDILPHPFSKTRSPFRDARQQQELAQLYADYQLQLVACSLVDAESAHWAARDALAARVGQVFHDLDLVVADGFTDFSRTQHEILVHLARGAKQLIVSLQADADRKEHDRQPANEFQTRLFSDESHDSTASVLPIDRPDLFAKTADTLAALRRHHPRLSVRHFAPQSSAWPAHDYLMRQLFCRPTPLPTLPADVVDSLNRVEFVQTAGAQDEIVQIARRIKRLLAGAPTQAENDGRARPADIIVVFRSLADSAARVREVFQQFGIPFWLESRVPLSTAAVCKALLSLLRLDDEDWPFRRVVSMITNNALTAIEDPARQAAEWLVRDLQIAQGRRTLIDRVEPLASAATSPSELSAHAARRAETAQLALPALRKLAVALDELPEKATPTAWSAALEQLGSRLGLTNFIRTGEFSDSLSATKRESPSSPTTDELAWQLIVAHFASLERLDVWLGQSPKVLSRRDVLAILADAAKYEQLPYRHDDVGRVRVLSAQSARGESAKQVFLAGMSEQAFPAPERAGRLCTEGEYRNFLRADGSQVARGSAGSPVTRSHEEMLLFYGVLACAEESLTISYPALDDKAQTLPPSPYVTEIRRILGAEQPLVRSSSPRLSPVPAGDTPFSRADWRIQAVAQALSGDSQLLAGLFRCATSEPLGRAIDAGLQMVHARARREAFGPAEGLLDSQAVAARFAERFGPQHLWSPSQWETYAACPYKFFSESVLRLEPLGDLELETDFMRRGSRLHDVLAEFHRLWTSTRSERSLPPDQEQAIFLEQLRKVIDGRMAAPRAGIEAALLELDRRQIRNWAEKHFEHHARYEALWSSLGARLEPAHFELRFGPARPGEAEAEDPHSCHDAFTLVIDGEPVRVTGRIDRIDVARIGEQVVFNVIDYKSGRKPSLKEDHLTTGEHLQLPIYVAAAQALVFDGEAQPLAAGYWTMAGGFDAKGVLAVQHGDDDRTQRWNHTRTTIEARIGQFITAIRHGDFPVFSRDDKCTSRCDFNTVCRVAQVRSLGKSIESHVEGRESRVESREPES